MFGGKTMKEDCVHYDNCRKPVSLCKSNCEDYRDVTSDELEDECQRQLKEDTNLYMSPEYH